MNIYTVHVLIKKYILLTEGINKVVHMRASIHPIPKWPYFSILLFTCTCKLACVALLKGKYSFEFGV